MPNGDAAPAWTKRPDGTVDAECGPLRLLAHPPARGAHARFVVLRRAEQGQQPGANLRMMPAPRVPAIPFAPTC